MENIMNLFSVILINFIDWTWTIPNWLGWTMVWVLAIMIVGLIVYTSWKIWYERL